MITPIYMWERFSSMYFLAYMCLIAGIVPVNVCVTDRALHSVVTNVLE